MPTLFNYFCIFDYVNSKSIKAFVNSFSIEEVLAKGLKKFVRIRKNWTIIIIQGLDADPGSDKGASWFWQMVCWIPRGYNMDGSKPIRRWCLRAQVRKKHHSLVSCISSSPLRHFTSSPIVLTISRQRPKGVTRTCRVDLQDIEKGCSSRGVRPLSLS